jgi:hypothetical protein
MVTLRSLQSAFHLIFTALHNGTASAHSDYAEASWEIESFGFRGHDGELGDRGDRRALAASQSKRQHPVVIAPDSVIEIFLKQL